MKKAALFLILYLLFTKIIYCQNFTIDDLKWIIGEWKVDKNQYEYWKNLNDSTLSGINFNILNGDTIFNENISIIKKNGILVFIANVFGQNEGKEIEFVLCDKSSFRNLIFENKYHDFPKTIIYTYISKNKLKSTIFGNKRTIEYNYLRLN